MEKNYMEKIKSYFIYTDPDNNITQIKEIYMQTKKGMVDGECVVPKMAIIKKIQEMKSDEFGNYIIKYIALHHIPIDDSNITLFLKDDIQNNTYMREISYFSDVFLKSTDPLFYDLSSLYFILQQKKHMKHNNTTKRIRITTNKLKKSMKKTNR